MLALPHTFTIKNSLELASKLTQLRITTTHKTVTFDISDLYVNLPTTELTTTTKFWLQGTLTAPTIIQQLITLVNIVLRQNYFQFDDHYYNPPPPRASLWDHHYPPPWLRSMYSALKKCSLNNGWKHGKSSLTESMLITY
jgi:hypothetical protein